MFAAGQLIYICIIMFACRDANTNILIWKSEVVLYFIEILQNLNRLNLDLE